MSRDIKWLIKLVFFFCISQLAAQTTNIEYLKERGFSFKIQGVYLNHTAYEMESEFDSAYQIGWYTNITGVNIELNYYLSPLFGIGIGTGYERISKPGFHYYPLYLNIIAPLSDRKNTFYVKSNLGGQLGIDGFGSLLRAAIGYRFKVYKNILSNLEITYVFQDMYKDLVHAEQIENYLNIQGVGISLGIEFN